MAELTIDRTYSGALFSVAEENDNVEQVRGELEQVAELFRQMPEFNAFFHNPTIGIAEKKQAFEKIFKGRVCREVLNFLFIVIDKGRTRYFPGMVKAYGRMCDEKEGFAYGDIFSATPLSKEHLEKFQAETGKLLNENVRLTNKIDPSLLGGVKILINGKIIDASLRKRLSDMGNNMI